jgi:hypothetical protein
MRHFGGLKVRADLDETAFARVSPAARVERSGVAAAPGTNEHAVTRERSPEDIVRTTSPGLDASHFTTFFLQ